ncbi:hypothetical protein [Thioclava dalianensis]|nr:hypothetical protein [Thioclava dalianensis]
MHRAAFLRNERRQSGPSSHSPELLTPWCSFTKPNIRRLLALVRIVNGSEIDHKMINDNTTVSFEQMKGAIGSLIFLWSQIERELAESLDALQIKGSGSSKPAHGIARRLDLWSGQIQPRNGQRELASRLIDVLVSHLREALSARNLVCHGLIGITAKIHPQGNEAHLTVELGDIRKKLTWTELQIMFRWMSRAHWLIRDLTTASLEPDHLCAENLLLGWQEFPDIS